MTLLNYVETNQSLIEQADRAYAEGDLEKAVDKAWEAAHRAVGNIAKRRGWKFDTRSEMSTAAERLGQETNQPDLDLFFQVAFIAPYNFREGWTNDAESVEYDLLAAKQLLSILQNIE